MQSLIIKAKAKINWTLDILGVNDDGYHVLDMLMQTVSLFDKVEIIKQKELQIKLVDNGNINEVEVIM